MTSAIEWLLGLHNIRLGRDAPLLLKWTNPIEAWIVFCFALVVLALIGMIYWRERTSPAKRTILAVIRCSIIALAVVVIARPVLVLQRNRVEPSYVALVIDRSLSMATVDRYGYEDGRAGTAHPTRSRLDLVKRALLEHEAAALRKLLERNAVQLSTFAGGVETAGFFASTKAADELSEAVRTIEADGATTDLPGTIAHIIDRAHGAAPLALANTPALRESPTDLQTTRRRERSRARLAAVVLATDGQSTQPGSLKDTLDLARDRQIPIYPIRIGSTKIAWDIEIGPPRAQETVFAGDILAVEVVVSARGLTRPTPVTVRLILEDSPAQPPSPGASVLAIEEIVLDPRGALDTPQGERGLRRAPTSTTVELRTKPSEPGRKAYRVEVVPHPDPKWGLAPESSTDNNVGRVQVTVLDAPLRVLFVDGYPRYEYRYLKNALVREPSIELSVLLIEADEAFVQEGTFPIRRFPETPEELNRFDVVLFGDVDPQDGWLTLAQMNMLLNFVGHEGGGFGLIAGERAAPLRFLGTPLEKLIPVRIDPTFLGHYETVLTSSFQPRLTREGRRSRLFRFHTDRSESQALFDALPELYWYARTRGPKPGASVLAEHPYVNCDADILPIIRPMPIVVTGRYGAGKLFFQATDSTWRWRRHRGELLHDTYWVQVVRELMRGSRVAGDRRFVVRTDRRIYPYGTPVRVEVTILDPELLAQQGDVVPLVALADRVGAAPPAQPGATIETATSTPTDTNGDTGVGLAVVARFNVHRNWSRARVSAGDAPPSVDRTGSAGRFEGSWIPPRPGGYAVAVVDLGSPGDERAFGRSVAFRVEQPDLEGRRPEANHDVLERIADATGGRVIELDELEVGFGVIRDRSVQIPDDVVAPLWDSKLVFLLFALMISMEWTLRKAFGL